jgi:hypothetical protein
MNSADMGKLCETMADHLWDDAKVEKLFVEATAVVDGIGGKNWDRDSIRTEPVTKSIFDSFGAKA